MRETGNLFRSPQDVGAKIGRFEARKRIPRREIPYLGAKLVPSGGARNPKNARKLTLTRGSAIAGPTPATPPSMAAPRIFPRASSNPLKRSSLREYPALTCVLPPLPPAWPSMARPAEAPAPHPLAAVPAAARAAAHGRCPRGPVRLAAGLAQTPPGSSRVMLARVPRVIARVFAGHANRPRFEP